MKFGNEMPDQLEVFDITAKQTILIVDDEKEIREVVRETLKINDFRILEAADGNSALEIIQRQRPDLILLDVKLPGTLDGFALRDQIRQEPEMREIPIIFLSAFLPKGEALPSQPNEKYFLKPFSPLQLISQVYQALSAREKGNH